MPVRSAFVYRDPGVLRLADRRPVADRFDRWRVLIIADRARVPLALLPYRRRGGLGVAGDRRGHRVWSARASRIRSPVRPPRPWSMPQTCASALCGWSPTAAGLCRSWHHDARGHATRRDRLPPRQPVACARCSRRSTRASSPASSAFCRRLRPAGSPAATSPQACCSPCSWWQSFAPASSRDRSHDPQRRGDLSAAAPIPTNDLRIVAIVVET